MRARENLNPMECRLVDEFLIDQDPRAAAIRAGYAKSTTQRQAVELITHPLMSAAIQEAMNERSQRTLITADSVLMNIQTVVMRCMQGEPVIDKRTGQPKMTRTADGTLAPAYVFDSRGALKGLELLGKHLKLFADELHVSGTIQHNHTVSDNLEVMGFKDFLDLARERESVASSEGLRLIEGGRVD